jgi:AcrR family transcriptional regulator
MRLLWRIELGRKRGPKPSLTLDEIVTAAIELADEEGFEAISMRRVAERLGVGAMSLYTYVPAKSDLMDLMYDRVIGEHSVTYPEDAGWRDRLDLMARAQWDLYRQHRWTVHMPWTRVPLGPNILDAYERSAAAIAGLGLTGREMTEVLTLVASYVRGAARLADDATTLPTTTSMDDAEWWAEVGSVLENVWDAARFPTLTGPEMANAWERDEGEHGYFMSEALSSFEFGLARVLDGIEVFIERRGS